ncbi:hypothetical protein [Streptomyces sp. G-G2]|uniref:hypothetical protein n=1 Tax=Streptomyces sp. G-G2 TaxID=3046201 RepID=UPI0024BAFFCE|nr:hypothetical protein [Streptomyces sp. G-G2]MDJ0382057.1 hypothetical protein [Streptomyces sp. G-G2]
MAPSIALSAVLATALLSVPAAVTGPITSGPVPDGPAAAVVSGSGQTPRETPLFSVRGPDNAAAQEFTADSARLTRVAFYLASGASTGTVTVQVRASRDSADSAVATRTLDLKALGGAGAGWVEVPLDGRLQAGSRYFLFVQAATPENKPVTWYGTRRAAASAPTSWNYDRPYWGGWHAETARLAFRVDPSDAERCGETEPCYLPASALAARTAGLLSNGTTVEAVTPSFTVGASYVDGSNVLRLPSGRWRYLPAGRAASVVTAANDPAALEQISESRAWLAAGKVPGTGTAERAVYQRALLSMRALLRPNGAFAAAWSPAWAYSWPRDGSFASAAFAATGHDAEAYRVLRYNQATQRPDGTWEARTTLDGAGPPDTRTWQLDANGWVPWATWQWYQAAPAQDRAARLTAVYPMVRKAADYAAGSLGADGLPPAGPDYWELTTATPNIGTAAPLLAGLNAAADLARTTGRNADADRWAVAAGRLSQGIATRFAPAGYPRTSENRRGRDSAAAFMAPPFNNAPAGLAAALDSTYDALLLPNGGLSPGIDPNVNWGAYAWTPSTTFLALAWAGTGQYGKADLVLDWVLAHRNGLGELSETVNGASNPSSVAPLGWTDSLVLLAGLAAQGSPRPTPPDATRRHQ